MKKSIFGAGLMFLGALLLVAPTRVPDGGSTPTPAPAAPPSVAPSNSPTPSLPADIPIVVDSVGDNVGIFVQIIKPIDQNNIQILVVPATMNKSQVYYPVSSASPTPRPLTLLLTVPPTLPVVFCSGAQSYDKHLGKCYGGDNPFVSKIVPISFFISNPTAPTPTGAPCSPPKAPTYDPFVRTWNCTQPPGYLPPPG